MLTRVELPLSDPEVMQGEVVFHSATSIPSERVEEWVKYVASLSGQRVDWGWWGHHVKVHAIGDLDRVREVIEVLTPLFDWMHKQPRESLYLYNEE